MEIIRWRKDKRDGYMVRIDAREAHRLIESLAAQLVSESANAGREEFLGTKGEYFSIAVAPRPLEQPRLADAMLTHLHLALRALTAPAARWGGSSSAR